MFIALTRIPDWRPMLHPDERRQAILRAREQVALTILHRDYAILIRRDQNAVNQWVYAAVGAYGNDPRESEPLRLSRAYLAVEALCAPTDERIADIVGAAVGMFTLTLTGVCEPLPQGHPRRAELEPDVKAERAS